MQLAIQNAAPFPSLSHFQADVQLGVGRHVGWPTIGFCPLQGGILDRLLLQQILQIYKVIQATHANPDGECEYQLQATHANYIIIKHQLSDLFVEVLKNLHRAGSCSQKGEVFEILLYL